MAERTMLLSAALMLAGAFVATGAWLLRRPGARWLLVLLGAGIFTAGVVTLARTLS